MNYPMNIWMINENEIDQFTTTGGKIIYIVEEPDHRLRMHPAIVTAGILLPPTDAINAELDDRLMEADMIYTNYLLSEEVYQYIMIILAAAVLGTPIGILFGRDELNMQFPKLFIDFLYKQHGLVIGIANKINPYIEEQYMNVNLAILYRNDIIDYKTFMEKHPTNYPILTYMVLDKMIAEIKPPVTTLEDCVMYFERCKNNAQKNGGQLLIDPLVHVV